MKKKDHLVRRYLVFFLWSFFFVSFGIAFVTKAQLGTSAISSIPYTLYLITGMLSMGGWTILFNYLLVAGQVIILKGKVNWIEIFLQLGVTLVFGYCIDFGMWILSDMDPVRYWGKILALLIGCLILAFGAYLEVVGDVVMLPGDGFSLVVARVSGVGFGRVRLISDSVMTGAAAVLCLVFLHALTGVREGTVIAALLVGNIISIYTRLLQPVADRILPKAPGVPYRGRR